MENSRSRSSLASSSRLIQHTEGHIVGHGLQTEFTGISAPYEAPPKPEIHIRTDEVDVKGAVEIITQYLDEQGLLKA